MTDDAAAGSRPTFHASADARTATARARGDVDLFTVDVLGGALDILLLAGRDDLLLDLPDVTTIDHPGAVFLTDTQRRLSDAGGSLRIVNVTETVSAALHDAHVRHTTD